MADGELLSFFAPFWLSSVPADLTTACLSFADLNRWNVHWRASLVEPEDGKNESQLRFKEKVLSMQII